MLKRQRMSLNNIVSQSTQPSGKLFQATFQPCFHCMVVIGDTLISNHTQGQCTKPRKHHRQISQGAKKYNTYDGEQPCLKCMKVYTDQCVFKHTIASCPKKHYLSYYQSNIQSKVMPDYEQQNQQQQTALQKISLLPVSVLMAKKRQLQMGKK